MHACCNLYSCLPGTDARANVSRSPCLWDHGSAPACSTCPAERPMNVCLRLQWHVHRHDAAVSGALARPPLAGEVLPLSIQYRRKSVPALTALVMQAHFARQALPLCMCAWPAHCSYMYMTTSTAFADSVTRQPQMHRQARACLRSWPLPSPWTTDADMQITSEVDLQFAASNEPGVETRASCRRTGAAVEPPALGLGQAATACCTASTLVPFSAASRDSARSNSGHVRRLDPCKQQQACP